MKNNDHHKEEIELELSQERHDQLHAIAKERGVTIDEVVEGFLIDAINEQRANHEAKSEKSTEENNAR